MDMLSFVLVSVLFNPYVWLMFGLFAIWKQLECISFTLLNLYVLENNRDITKILALGKASATPPT